MWIVGGKNEVPRETLFPVREEDREERTDKATSVGLRISYGLKSSLQLNVCQELQIFVFVYMYLVAS
jgi:hypothetical protein